MTHTASPNAALIRSGKLVARIALAVAMFGLPASMPTPAEAISNNRSCRITTYYQSATLQTEVGVRTNCPGAKRWGRTSPHFEVEIFDLDAGGTSGTGGGGGNLPCEFLASGCSNLPTNRN